jgi:phasin family protein
MAKAPEPNLNSVTDQIKEMVEKFKLPGVDAQALVEQQRNNINAAVETMRITADGTHSVAKRQLELFHTASTQLLSMFSETKLKPEERAELAKKAFDAALAGSRELYDITAKASEEAFSVARQRVTEGVEQLRKHIERKDG